MSSFPLQMWPEPPAPAREVPGPILNNPRHETAASPWLTEPTRPAPRFTMLEVMNRLGNAEEGMTPEQRTQFHDKLLGALIASNIPQDVWTHAIATAKAQTGNKP